LFTRAVWPRSPSGHGLLTRLSSRSFPRAVIEDVRNAPGDHDAALVRAAD
jgi:hypothetical protein